MASFNIEFFSNALKRPVTFKMFIPNDKNNEWSPELKRDGKPIKTIFLIHGYTGGAENWIPGDLATTYNVAVVMPYGENGFWVDGIATGRRYGTYLTQELVDYVRNTFHLAMSKEDTFIMGYSMGGYGALRAALACPDTFGKVVALSSALIIHEIAGMKEGNTNPVANYEYYRDCFGNLDDVLNSKNNPEVLVDDIIKSGKEMPEIFMACGTEDFLLENNRQLHAFLDDRKVKHVYIESEGNHNMEFWQKYASEFLPDLFDDIDK